MTLRLRITVVVLVTAVVTCAVFAYVVV
ncbi:MAG: hypothetical protein QOI44_1196, partial [Actinomycetota bacterium]|nr:hypothetical protein [Actinomycetota bacterium]